MGRTLPVAAIAILVAAACAPTDPAADFDDAFGELDEEFGNGKADLFGIPDPCELLAPLLEYGDSMTHAGLFVGVSGEAVLGPAVGFGGMDLVWDLWDQQFTVARFKGAGIALPTDAGASVQAFTGAAFGFQGSVADWFGYFVTGNLSIGLPFLKDYASVDTALFVSGVDDNGDAVIEPGEVLVPPDGVYGFQVGVQLGFDLLPDPLPVSGNVVEGEWDPYDRAIRNYYDRFRAAGIAAGLVTPAGDACSADWPLDGSGGRCVIELGDPDDSWLWRSLDTARAICHATRSCSLPLTWPLSATAIAIGAVRSSGLKPSALCE